MPATRRAPPAFPPAKVMSHDAGEPPIKPIKSVFNAAGEPPIKPMKIAHHAAGEPPVKPAKLVGVSEPEQAYAPIAASKRGSAATLFDESAFAPKKGFGGRRDTYGFNAPSSLLVPSSSRPPSLASRRPSTLASSTSPTLASFPSSPMSARTLVDSIPPTPRTPRSPLSLDSVIENEHHHIVGTLSAPVPALTPPATAEVIREPGTPPSPTTSDPFDEAVHAERAEEPAVVLKPEIAAGVTPHTRTHSPTLQWLDDTATKLRPPVVKYGYYGVAICAVYFVLVGFPLWNGVVYSIWVNFYKADAPFGFLIFSFLNWAFVFFPLIFGRYEKPADPLPEGFEREKTQDCALLIPCYKAAGALPNTIEHALAIYPAESIFVVNNANSPVAPDNTEEVCQEYGVNYLFVPVGSKIGAEYVGLHQKKMDKFKYVMIIDDDVELPNNLPIVSERFEKDPRVGCVGYTLVSTGAKGSKGTMVQQLQDLEYRLSGLRHCMGGLYGSATFGHGAILLFKVDLLKEFFKEHPGYKMSEDLCFGIITRMKGYYVDFCSSCPVKTETPPHLFGPRVDHPIDTTAAALKRFWARLQRMRRSNDLEAQAGDEKEGPATRGGYGEMSVYKQRYERWAFLHAGLLVTLQLKYHIVGWNLGKRTLVAQILSFQDTLSTLFFLFLPIVLPLSFYWNAPLTAYTIIANTSFGFFAAVIFNAWHLRNRPEGRISWAVPFVSVPYKFILRFVQVAAIYRGIFRYGIFFAEKTHKLPAHPKLGPMAERVARGEDA